jgi:hypothetical protein
MSISASPRIAGPFVANGVQTAFAFEFKVLSGDDVLVTQTDAEGVQTEIATGYSVSLNADQDADPGGTVTYVTAPDDCSVTLTSRTAIEQPAEFPNTSAFYPSVVEDSLDRLTIIAQEQNVLLERAFRFPYGSDVLTLGDIAEGEVLQRVGDVFVGITPDNFAAPAAASAAAAAASAVAADGEADAAEAFADNASDSADIAAVGASLVSVLSRTRETIAEGMADFEIGESFASPETGIMRAYYKTGAATYDEYPLAEQGEAGAPGGGSGTVTSVAIGGGASGLSSVAPVTTSGSLEITGTLAIAHGGTGATDASGARTALGLVIGTNVQAYSASLTSWAAKTVPAGTIADLTTSQTMSSKTLTAPTITGFTETTSAPSAGTAFSPNLSTATAFYYQTNGNTTITLPTPVAGKSFSICVKYGGSHTLSWAGGARKWPGGVAPTATSTVNKFDEFVFRCYDGTSWLASASGANF